MRLHTSIQWRWQVNLREPGDPLVLLTGLPGDAGYQLPQGGLAPRRAAIRWNQPRLAASSSDPYAGAQATFPVGIDLVSLAREADGKALQATDQDADGDTSKSRLRRSGERIRLLSS